MESKTFSLSQLLQQKDFFIQEACNNKLFVYPTDTLYGIWGIFSHENIARIHHIKQKNRGAKLSIIAPSFDRIFEHFIVSDPDYLFDMFNAYHGVTYILTPKSPQFEYALYDTSYEDQTIGVRVIKHPFQEFVTALGKPFISTSANISGEENCKTLDAIHPTIISQVDYCIDGHEVFWKPSMLVFVDTQNVIER